jgi:hypothetical protein
MGGWSGSIRRWVNGLQCDTFRPRAHLPRLLLGAIAKSTLYLSLANANWNGGLGSGWSAVAIAREAGTTATEQRRCYSSPEVAFRSLCDCQHFSDPCMYSSITQSSGRLFKLRRRQESGSAERRLYSKKSMLSQQDTKLGLRLETECTRNRLRASTVPTRSQHRPARSQHEVNKTLSLLCREQM